ncbi:glycosyltransferase [Arcobacter sp. s6]|uniref:glycosyltransferase n=1 Tax=Arcobacter sp. s6 TaxID=3230363 RepID=UPI0034A0ABC0
MIINEYKIIKKSVLFDEKYYLKTYEDVRRADIDPIKHYIENGWKEGRNPSERFDTTFYLTKYPDVKSSGINPLIHFIRFGRYENRNTHGENSLECMTKKDSKIKKLIKITKYIKKNPYIIKKFINEAKNFGLKNAIKKAKAKSGISNSVVVTNIEKPKCTFVHSGKQYDIKVSVIIPTYNRLKLLPNIIECWKKVDKVTKYKYEIIFSDDGSEDGSLEFLEQVNDLPIIVLRNDHGGASKARNNAISHAKGEKLYIIGDDIFPNPQIINQHYEKLKELPICKAVLGEVIWHRDLKVNTLMKHITELGCEQFSFNAFPSHGYIDFRHFYTCNISIDKEFLLSEEIIFDETFNKYGFEDIELGYRLFKKGMDIYYFNEAIGEHYHPYTSVKNFCIRQENAGNMALVFKKLHKEEVEWVLQIEQISREWLNYIRDTKTYEDNNNLDRIIDICQYLEDEMLINEHKLEKDISNIYRTIFRFYYEKGVIENSYSLEKGLINVVFTKYYLPQIVPYIKNIEKYVKDDFFNNLDEILIQNNQLISKLIIEVEDFNSIEMVREYYKEYINEIHIRIKSEAISKNNNYIYRPKNGFLLNPINLKQLILFIENNPYIDVLLLSFGLVDFPNLGFTETLENHIILKDEFKLKDDFTKLNGKVIRLIGENNIKSIKINSIINCKIDEYGYWNKRGKECIENNFTKLKYINKNKDKKLVFVFPIFLAVGGVERNTVEIINSLKDKYDFVVINFERLNESLGSLHHQFILDCIAIYDLTELSTHDGILNYLKILNNYYNPELVWICNGSPWLEYNLLNIRNIFINSGIIDQQVYDTKEGWVRLYKDRNPELLSFDKFIAVNSKIHDLFINESGIDTSKVKLIYSVMSDKKRVEALSLDKSSIYEKYNLDVEQKYIVSIGRMTSQKAPLDLIKLIKKVVDNFNYEYKFLIVGSGELSQKVDEMINHYNLNNFIIRMDYVDNTYELDLISEAIIFTSLFEGLSIALLEALSVGTPAISTDVGDTKLLLERYQNGIIFDNIGDIGGYYSIFCDFIKNYKLYKKKAIENKEIILEKFSKPTISQNYIELFENTILEKNRTL